MKKKVLIAEDIAVNRAILRRILAADYIVLEAENGQVALEQINRNAATLSAVILDLHMPVLSGYDVMEALREKAEYRNIPIVVATGNNDRESELKALKLGAWDFVTKPYDPEILKFRLNNAIQRSRLNLLEQLKRQAEYDGLTGLYNENKFCQVTRRVLDEHPEQQFAIIRFDVDRFKQFNSFFGVPEGNHFLCHIAELLQKAAATGRYPNAVYARQEADVFVVCTPYSTLDALRDIIELAREQIRSYTARFNIVTVYGIYPVSDRTLPVSEMVDRATLAARTRKGSYENTVAVYTDEMSARIAQEQEIINEMDMALEQNQFLVYYQPKYNIAENRLSGAEALVRWKHPEKGLIPPGLFIPVLEKNGFVARVDYFVWERTCKNLRRWCDAGLAPKPVSVNISRVNLSNPRIVEIITDLVKKYGIEPRLLELEITESAYMDNPETMNGIVDKFHENGFTILMDDFGSGYSSLNTLKEISVDILKVDMKFLPTGENTAKSEKILASIIRMADWIGMPVICEGVETVEQRDFLQSVGCLYVQGYLYGRPMPVAEYEALLARSCSEAQPPRAEAQFDLDAVLSSDSSTGTLLKSLGVPIVIYSYDRGHYERVRANPCFFDTFGYEDTAGAQIVRVAPSDREKVDHAFEEVAASRTLASCEALFLMADGTTRWYQLNLWYIVPERAGQLISAVFTEITAAKRAENEMARIMGILNHSRAPRRSMLIVDDSEVSRVLLHSMFGDEFNIFEAADGCEALQVLEKHAGEVRIILLDMLMPKMDGAEFLERKAQLPGAARIPVVIISADDREARQVNMLQYGVNDYITKPFVPEVVCRRVYNVLEYQSRFEELVHEYKQETELKI